jgi:hypothetical protein
MTKMPNRLLIKGNLSYPPIEEPKFYTPVDEAVFYEWLEKIKLVKSYSKSPDGLIVELVDGPYEDNELCDLIAIFSRYNLDKTQFAAFETEENQ